MGFVGWLSVSVFFVGWLSVSVGFVGWLSWSSNYTGCFVFYIITNKCTINTITVYIYIYISQQSLCVMYTATCFDTFLSSSPSYRLHPMPRQGTEAVPAIMCNCYKNSSLKLLKTCELGVALAVNCLTATRKCSAVQIAQRDSFDVYCYGTIVLLLVATNANTRRTAHVQCCNTPQVCRRRLLCLMTIS